MLDCLRDGFAPGEGGVTGDEDARYSNGVQAFCAEAADDDCAGVAHVGGGDLLGGQGFSNRNRAVQVVSVSGAKAGDGAACLSPGGGELGVSVDAAADLGNSR